MKAARLGTARRTRSLAGLSVLVAAVLAAPPAAAEPAESCDPTGAFCISYELGLSSTTAASPLAVTLDLANTSASFPSSTATWMRRATVALAGRPGQASALTGSASLPDKLLIAGGDTASCGAPSFTDCDAGHGTFAAKVTGSGFYDGIRSGTFGIRTIANVNPPTAGSYVTWVAEISACLPYGGNACFFAENETVSLEVPPPGSDGSGTVTVETGFTGTLGGASYDATLGTIHLALPGQGDKLKGGASAGGTHTYLRVPALCGPASGTATAEARGGAQASAARTITVTGCPTVAVSHTESFRTTSAQASAAAGTPGRTVTGYRWSWGYGATELTQDPSASHTYANSATRTVAVRAVDDAGALSHAATFTLTGTALTATAPASVTYGGAVRLTGKLTEFGTTAGLGGRPVALYRRPKGAGTFAQVATATTDGAGAYTFTHKPAANSDYRVRHCGQAGWLGSYSPTRAVLVKAKVSSTASATSVRLGSTVTISGSVAPSHAGQGVVLQRYSSGAWRTVSTRTLSSTSRFSFTVKPGSRATFSYRVHKPGDADHAAGTGPKHTISVT